MIGKSQPAKDHGARRITVSDDLVPSALNCQGGDQTRQQRFCPAGLRAGGRETKTKTARKRKNKPLAFDLPDSEVSPEIVRPCSFVALFLKIIISATLSRLISNLSRLKKKITQYLSTP